MDNDAFIPEMMNPDLGSMYSRQSGSENVNGTYIPGMHVNAVDAESSKETAPNHLENVNYAPKMPVGQGASAMNGGQSVVGFLYSVSRKGLGEYWPLHLGTNTIGRTDANEIQLKEQTISDKHAVISIKKMKSTGKMIASVKDVGSKNGMFLNDEELDYDNHTCKNGDIITVGSNYQLLFILINAEDYGLKVSEGFKAVSETKAPSIWQNRPKVQDPNSTVSLGGMDEEIGGATQML